MDPSPDRYTEITTESWLGRLRGALAGVVFGLVLFLLSFPLLFWNEGRAVRRYRTLAEGAAAVRSVSSDAVDPADQGALVHVTGQAGTEETLTDPTFEVSVVALKLRRRVQMYQWRETSERKERKKLGGGTETVTTYEYELVWEDHANDSSDFNVPDGHRNPAMAFAPETWVADRVRLGAYDLASSQVARIDEWSRVTVLDDSPVPAAIAGRGTVSEGGYYLGDPASRAVGDLRVRFDAVYPLELSVVAEQAGSGLAPFHTSGGGTIELVEPGAHGAEAMFAGAQASNRALTWVLRVVGVVAMFLGLAMALRPLVVLADVVPLLGNLVETGTGLIALLVALLLSLLTIATAWLFYRPMLALGLLAVGGALLYVITVRMRSRTAPARA